MAKLYTQKCRLCRAAGEKLFLKGDRCFTKCPIDKKGAVPPGQHGHKGRKRLSDYGIRLKEKQKLKILYGLTEKEMKEYFTQARKSKQSTGEKLFQILESRLDNLVYRLGFAPSRRSARQLVSHKHVLVDGKVVNIPSYLVKPGEVITLEPKTADLPLVKSMLEKKDFKTPDWLEKKALGGRMSRLPKREEIDAKVDEQLVIEYYSR